MHCMKKMKMDKISRIDKETLTGSNGTKTGSELYKKSSLQFYNKNMNIS